MALIDDWTRYLDVRAPRRHNALSQRRIIDHMNIVNAKPSENRVMVDADVFLHTVTKRRLNRVLKYDANRWLWRLWI